MKPSASPKQSQLQSLQRKSIGSRPQLTQQQKLLLQQQQQQQQKQQQQKQQQHQQHQQQKRQLKQYVTLHKCEAQSSKVVHQNPTQSAPAVAAPAVAAAARSQEPLLDSAGRQHQTDGGPPAPASYGRISINRSSSSKAIHIQGSKDEIPRPTYGQSIMGGDSSNMNSQEQLNKSSESHRSSGGQASRDQRDHPESKQQQQQQDPSQPPTPLNLPLPDCQHPHQQQPELAFWQEIGQTSDMLAGALKTEAQRLRQGQGSLATVMELRGLLSEVEKLKQRQKQRQPLEESEQQQQQQQAAGLTNRTYHSQISALSESESQSHQQRQQTASQSSHIPSRVESHRNQQQQPGITLSPDRQRLVTAEIERILRVLDAVHHRGLHKHAAMTQSELANLTDTIRRMDPKRLNSFDFELLSDVRQLVASLGSKLSEQRQHQHQHQNQQLHQHQHSQQQQNQRRQQMQKEATQSSALPHSNLASFDEDTAAHKTGRGCSGFSSEDQLQLTLQIDAVINGLRLVESAGLHSMLHTTRDEVRALISDLRTVNAANATEVERLLIRQLDVRLSEIRQAQLRPDGEAATALAATSETRDLRDKSSSMWLARSSPATGLGSLDTLHSSEQAADRNSEQRLRWEEQPSGGGGAAAAVSARQSRPQACTRSQQHQHHQNQGVKFLCTDHTHEPCSGLPRKRSVLRDLVRRLGYGGGALEGYGIDGAFSLDDCVGGSNSAGVSGFRVSRRESIRQRCPSSSGRRAQSAGRKLLQSLFSRKSSKRRQRHRRKCSNSRSGVLSDESDASEAASEAAAQAESAPMDLTDLRVTLLRLTEHWQGRQLRDSNDGRLAAAVDRLYGLSGNKQPSPRWDSQQQQQQHHHQQQQQHHHQQQQHQQLQQQQQLQQLLMLPPHPSVSKASPTESTLCYESGLDTNDRPDCVDQPLPHRHHQHQQQPFRQTLILPAGDDLMMLSSESGETATLVRALLDSFDCSFSLLGKSDHRSVLEICGPGAGAVEQVTKILRRIASGQSAK